MTQTTLAEAVKDIIWLTATLRGSSVWGLDTNCGELDELVAEGTERLTQRLGLAVCKTCGELELLIDGKFCQCSNLQAWGTVSDAITDLATIAAEPGKVEVREVQTTMAQDIARQIEQGSHGPEWSHR
jgi:hypothetical protein